MGDPCKKEVDIAELKADRNNLAKTLERIEDGQSEFIAVLRGISAQGEQIKSLVQRLEKNEIDIQALYVRMREVELSPGKQISTLHASVIMIIISSVVAFLSKKIGG